MSIIFVCMSVCVDDGCHRWIGNFLKKKKFFLLLLAWPLWNYLNCVIWSPLCAADGFHHDFPSIKCHAGKALIDFHLRSSSRNHFSSLFIESFDVGAVVHHFEVNYEASNWSRANLLSDTSHHHLGEPRSWSDLSARLWHSGKLKTFLIFPIFRQTFHRQMLKEYEKSALAKKNQLLHLLEI